MFLDPLLISSRTASRNCTLPSPRVIRPLRSRTVTPSTSREAIVRATETPPCSGTKVIAPTQGDAGKRPCKLLKPAVCSLISSVGGLVRISRGRQVFYQGQLGARMQLSKVYLIHEGADEEDSAAGAAQKVFGVAGVG